MWFSWSSALSLSLSWRCLRPTGRTALPQPSFHCPPPGSVTQNRGSRTPQSEPGPGQRDHSSGTSQNQDSSTRPPLLRTRTRATGPQLWDPSEPGRGSRTPCIQPGLGHWDHSSGTTQNQGSSTRPPSLRTRTWTVGSQRWDPSEPGQGSGTPHLQPGPGHRDPSEPGPGLQAPL